MRSGCARRETIGSARGLRRGVNRRGAAIGEWVDRRDDRRGERRRREGRRRLAGERRGERFGERLADRRRDGDRLGDERRRRRAGDLREDRTSRRLLCRGLPSAAPSAPPPSAPSAAPPRPPPARRPTPAPPRPPTTAPSPLVRPIFRGSLDERRANACASFSVRRKNLHVRNIGRKKNIVATARRGPRSRFHGAATHTNAPKLASTRAMTRRMSIGRKFSRSSVLSIVADSGYKITA